MEVNLVVVEGRPLGQVIPLRPKQYVIGRDADCQLRPKSPTVSSRHCAILKHENHVIIRDLGSTNGTLVNDRCLRNGEEIRVSDGDRLQVGQLIFTVRISAGSPGIETSLDEWLKPSADEEEAQDANTRTLLLSAIQPSRRPSGAEPSMRVPTPNSEAPTKFAYRRLDPATNVACLGLAQAQLNGDEPIQALRRSLLNLSANPKYRRLVLDLTAVESLPSAACTILLSVSNRWKDLGGEVRLCSLKPDVKRMIVALRLHQPIKCFDQRGDAVVERWG